MTRPSKQSLFVVTGLRDDRTARLEARTVDDLLEVLCRRARRLVDDPAVCEKLRSAFRAFVNNTIEYFIETGQMDDFVMTNIMTALATADSHRLTEHGAEDYGTFVRRLNPSDPDTDAYFVIGRAGRIEDPDCPLRDLERSDGKALARIPSARLHVLRAYRYARSMDVTRNAPMIPVAAFEPLVPREVRDDPEMEEAFLNVCFSDGAWELYRRKLAA